MKKKETTERRIPVKVRIPDNVSESVRQHKLSQIYDILKPKTEKAEKHSA